MTNKSTPEKYKEEFYSLTTEMRGKLTVPVQNDNNALPNFEGNQTSQQLKRDGIVTEILEEYKNICSNKRIFTENARNKLFDSCLYCLKVLIWTCVGISIFLTLMQAGLDDSASSIVSIVSVYISFTALIVSLLKVIMTYVFPPNDDKGITKIVQSIQTNDLEDKKENLFQKRWEQTHKNNIKKIYTKLKK